MPEMISKQFPHQTPRCPRRPQAHILQANSARPAYIALYYSLGPPPTWTTSQVSCEIKRTTRAGMFMEDEAELSSMEVSPTSTKNRPSNPTLILPSSAESRERHLKHLQPEPTLQASPPSVHNSPTSGFTAYRIEPTQPPIIQTHRIPVPYARFVRHTLAQPKQK